MIQRMDDAVEASRLESLILNDQDISYPVPEHSFSKVKLTAKGEKRL